MKGARYFRVYDATYFGMEGKSIFIFLPQFRVPINLEL